MILKRTKHGTNNFGWVWKGVHVELGAKMGRGVVQCKIFASMLFFMFKNVICTFYTFIKILTYQVFADMGWSPSLCEHVFRAFPYKC